MTCEEAIYSDQVADYVVTYDYSNDITNQYQPVCYSLIDTRQAVIYREEAQLDIKTLFQFGYSSIPVCYGLMSEAALQNTGVLQVRRQPYLDLF